MNDRTRQQALKALDGMRQIVENEMLIRGSYATEDIVKPEMKGSVCGGRQYCAIGSLWVGYGVKMKRDPYGGWYLPGAGEEDAREDFLRHRPGLRTAYNALNDAAQRYIDANSAPYDYAFGARIEGLFEYVPDEDGPDNDKALGRENLLGIIADAKRQVESV